LMFRDLGKADYRIVNIHLVCILISGEWGHNRIQKIESKE
jgi:hypothetical protein